MKKTGLTQDGNVAGNGVVGFFCFVLFFLFWFVSFSITCVSANIHLLYFVYERNYTVVGLANFLFLIYVCFVLFCFTFVSYVVCLI